MRVPGQDTSGWRLITQRICIYKCTVCVCKTRGADEWGRIELRQRDAENQPHGKRTNSARWKLSDKWICSTCEEMRRGAVDVCVSDCFVVVYFVMERHTNTHRRYTLKIQYIKYSVPIPNTLR